MPLSSEEILSQFGGKANNDLNNILDIDEIPDPDGEIADLNKTEYIDSAELSKYLYEHRNEFSIMSLNIQSIRAKFDLLNILLSELYDKELAFSVICLQESWLRDEDDITPYLLPEYHLINQGRVCSKHGGLMIYVKDSFTYKIQKLYKKSDIWEGLFIEIKGDQLIKPITIGNIYRPPFDNNSNSNVENFIQQFNPVIDKISRNNSHAIILGDYDIDLLKIQEREKYGEFLDLMCTHGLFPKITLPSRLAKKSCSLIDQIYCKFPNPNFTFAPIVVKSRISDHCPCVTSINLLQPKVHTPKFIKIRRLNDDKIEMFKNEILAANMTEKINCNLGTDPNISYAILEETITKAKDKYFPRKKRQVK